MKALFLAVIALAASCQTPLAPTSRPILASPGLVGDWSMVLEGSGPEDAWPVSIEKIQRTEPQGLLKQLGFRPGPELARYRAQAQLPSSAGGDEDGTESATFDCQVVEAGGHEYLTFQRALSEQELAYIYFFEVPLQNTLRMELDGDELRLLIHEKRYVWVPMALSGKMEMGDDEEVPGFLGALVPTLAGR